MLEWYGKRGDYSEETLAQLRSNGLTPGATSMSGMVEMFEGVGGFDVFSTLDCRDTVAEVFTFDFIQQALKEGNPIAGTTGADTGRSSSAMIPWARKPPRTM